MEGMTVLHLSLIWGYQVLALPCFIGMTSHEKERLLPYVGTAMSW